MLVPLSPTTDLERRGKSVLRDVAILLLAGLLVCAPAALVMWNVGEALPLARVAGLQEARQVPYLPYFEIDEFTYKLDIYTRFPPNVAVIGSSLPLPITAAYVSGPFVNLGRSMPYISYGPPLLDLMLAIHRPKLVVFVLDFWWFNKAYDDVPRTSPARDRLPHWSVRRALAPYSWLLAGTITRRDFANLLRLDPLRVGSKGLGLKAFLTGQGYDPQGAFTWLDQPVGPVSHDFAETLERVKLGRKRFEYGDHVDPGRWAVLTAMRGRLEAESIPAVIILPPVASRIANAMASTGQYGYLADLRKRIAAMPLAFDMMDAPTFGLTDCQFIEDGFHATTTGWARIVRRVAGSLPPDLARHFDVAGADRQIAAYESVARSEGLAGGQCPPERR